MSKQNFTHMRTAYILHGVCDMEEYMEMDFPSPSNAHWLPWLQQKFLRSNILCQCLELPIPPKANYEAWKSVFSQAQLRDDSIIVAHSAGCGFMLKWLSENPQIKLDKLVMVAPWLDPFEKFKDFLQGELDKNLEDRIGQMDVLYSSDEPVEGVKETTDEVLHLYPKTKLHRFENMGHFCLSNTGEKFEKLWKIINV